MHSILVSLYLFSFRFLVLRSVGYIFHVTDSGKKINKNSITLLLQKQVILTIVDLVFKESDNNNGNVRQMRPQSY